MRAAPHALAVGVEDQRRNVGQPIVRHRLREAPLQPFDGQRRRNLPNEPPSIRKAGLDRHPAPRARVIAVGRLGQQGLQKAPAMFQRALCFKQGRDIDLALYPKQTREIKRRQHGGRLLALGDQHPHRAVGVDVVQDLGHRQEQPDGGGILNRQRGEIGAQRLGLRQQLAHFDQGGLAAKVQLAIGIDPAADGVLQL